MPVLKRTRSETYLSARESLKVWTNVGLSAAVLIGIVVAWRHGGGVTSALAWSGAALGAGGLLGFLFGIPAPAGRQPAAQQVPIMEPPKEPAAGDPPEPRPAQPPPAGQEPQRPAGGPPPPAAAPLQQRAEAPQQTVAATKQPAPEVSSQPAFLPGAESNLEQVADWVTKLLLGGGLTQLQQIPGKVWELAGWVARGIAPAANGAALAAQQSFASGLLIYFFLLGFFSGYLITKLQLGDRFSF
jgi:hypothetical protein